MKSRHHMGAFVNVKCRKHAGLRGSKQQWGIAQTPAKAIRQMGAMTVGNGVLKGGGWAAHKGQPRCYCDRLW